MFILASASQARRRLLEQVGINHRIIVSGFDENKVQIEDPKQLVQSLAQSKAEAVSKKTLHNSKAIKHSNIEFILGCDSIFEFQGKVFGKPKTPSEALERWQKMSSNSGYLHTGHALLFKIQSSSFQDATKFNGLIQAVVTTKITFSQLTPFEIKQYVNTGEPLNCAGGFALEGKAGMLISSIEGCYSNVIGLSLPWLKNALKQANLMK